MIATAKSQRYWKFGLLLIAALGLAVGYLRHHFIMDGDARIGKSDGIVTVNGRVYDGWVLQIKFDSLTLLPFKSGLLHGKYLEFSKTGRLLAVRSYNDGEKVGLHRGWYPSGAKRYSYQFDNGQHHGDAWEWQEDGAPYLYQRFEHGQEIAQRIWRRDGKIYANYVTGFGELHGLTGGRLCITTPGENK